jgi:hypothetical protein
MDCVARRGLAFQSYVFLLLDEASGLKVGNTRVWPEDMGGNLGFRPEKSSEQIGIAV